jgi:hypothetical protein
MQYASLYQRGALDEAGFEEKLKGFLLQPGTDEHCVWCRGSMNITDDRLTPGLVRTLLKLKGAVFIKGENDIKIHKLTGKLAFTLSEHSNFHKLRKHGLVHWVKKDGKIKRGHWLITRKGWEFLAGQAIPAVVFTYNDQVVAHSPETTTIYESIREEKYWRDIDDYLATRMPAGHSLASPSFVPKYAEGV